MARKITIAIILISTSRHSGSIRRHGQGMTKIIIRGLSIQVETLLETANRNNVKIASSCTMGTCKSCKVKVKRGSVVMDEPNMLSMQEAEDGYVLACVAYPCESVLVKLPPR